MKNTKWTDASIMEYYKKNIKGKNVKLTKDHKKWYDIVMKKYKADFPKNTVKEYIKFLESDTKEETYVTQLISFIEKIFNKAKGRI